MNQSKTILIVDDEPRTREGLSRMLNAWSAGKHRIISAGSGAQALELLKNESVHLLITDIRMPEISGLQLITAMSETNQHKPVVLVMSGYAEFEYAQKALQLGVVGYLLKPLNRKQLIEAVEKAILIDQQRYRVGQMTKIVDTKLLEAHQSDLHENESIRAANLYVDEHLHEPFSLRQVANHVHLNPSYFSVLFKEQMHMTFSEYITRRRLQRAKEMLLHTVLPVTEISEQVGYKTAKYFTTIFKEYEGISPGQYRSELKRTDEEI